MQGIEELLKSNFSMIPMKAEAKEPAVYWKYYQRKRATIREIERWHKQFGETNYAIICGLISDLGVIDVDDLKQMPTLLMMLPDLLNTCVIRTPRPGLQFYFKLQGRYIRSTNKLFGLSGVELRCEGRYVMSPGSKIKGIEYIFERPLTCILPVPKIITDLYQETYKETVTTKGTKIPITYRGKAKCISQILNYDIPEPGREMAYFIVYSKLVEAGNTPEYAKYIIRLGNKELSDSLPEKEINNFTEKMVYPYGCPRINEELSFIDCSGCQIRGGLKVESLLMRSIHKLKDLTSPECKVLSILDTYYRGEETLPSITEVSNYITNMNYKTVSEAMKELKRKGII